MVFQTKGHHVKHEVSCFKTCSLISQHMVGGRPLNIPNIPRIMILLIARNMFDDVQNIGLELVYLVQVCQLNESVSLSVSLSESYFESYQWYFPSQIGRYFPWKLCICVEGLSMCRHSNEGNPLTEHVQSVYWACTRYNNEGKSSDDPIFDSFD